MMSSVVLDQAAPECLTYQESLSGTTAADNSEAAAQNRNRSISGRPQSSKVQTIVEELRPEDIRWMYREYGTRKWIPFIGYDSLRIECKFREMQHSLSRKILSLESVCDELINVRGGLYEVDVMKMKCFPVYWSSAGDYINLDTFL